MNKILITGGTGFFGKSILSYLSKNQKVCGDQTIFYILSRDPERFLAENPIFAAQGMFQFIKGNILDPRSLPTSLIPDAIIHAAADSTTGPILAPLERFEQIVAGTQNLLAYAASTGVRRFLYVSSGAVYGEIFSPGAEERDLTSLNPLDERQVYGLAKLTAEHLCMLYGAAQNFETIIARCFAFIGPDLPYDAHFAIGNFIRDALWGEEIIVNGDGEAVRSYLFQDDLADWLIQILINGRAGTAYNVGSDEAITIGNLASLVCETLSPSKNVKILGSSSKNLKNNYYVPQISKIRTELGANVKYSLIESIIKTAKSYESKQEKS